MAAVTDSMWQQRFVGRSDIIGTAVSLDERPHTLVIVATLAATSIPARRATRVEPIVALRSE